MILTERRTGSGAPVRNKTKTTTGGRQNTDTRRPLKGGGKENKKMIKINGVKVHGLKEAVGQYNYLVEARGRAYIFFDEEDGEVWASKDNWRRYLNWHIVGDTPTNNKGGRKATMESVKARIAWITSEERKTEDKRRAAAEAQELREWAAAAEREREGK